MKFNRMKCKQIVLRFNCHNKLLFFGKGFPSNYFFDLITTLKCPAEYIFVLVQFEDRVN